MSCIHFHITFYILLFFVTTVQWCDQLTSVCCGGDGLTAPQNTIGPSRNAAFFARVKIIAKQIVLVRRYEVGRTLVEAVKNLRPQNAIKNQKKWRSDCMPQKNSVTFTSVTTLANAERFRRFLHCSIMIYMPSARHQSKLQGQGTSASHGVPVYLPAHARTKPNCLVTNELLTSFADYRPTIR